MFLYCNFIKSACTAVALNVLDAHAVISDSHTVTNRWVWSWRKNVQVTKRISVPTHSLTHYLQHFGYVSVTHERAHTAKIVVHRYTLWCTGIQVCRKKGYYWQWFQTEREMREGECTGNPPPPTRNFETLSQPQLVSLQFIMLSATVPKSVQHSTLPTRLCLLDSAYLLQKNFCHGCYNSYYTMQ